MTTIQVVDGGSTSFDALFFPRQNPINTHYIQQNISNVMQKLNESGRNFFQSTLNTTAKLFDPDEIAKATRHLTTMAKNFFFDPNNIYPITTLDDLQTASLQMQRWVMAEPSIRQAYLSQQIDGYSDTYVNVGGDSIGNTHWDYRRVMSGIITPNNSNHYVNFFMDEGEEHDRELTTYEKFDILSTWEIAKLMLDNGLDPTNPYS